MAPTHYLNQCQLYVVRFPGIHVKNNSKVSIEGIILRNDFENNTLKILSNLPGDNELIYWTA